MPGFLTLEGANNKRRRKWNLNDLCGVAPQHGIFKTPVLTAKQATARRTAEIAAHAARTQAEEERYYPEAERTELMHKREDLFKSADDPSATQSIFAHYGIESGMSDDDIALHLGKLTLCGLVFKGEAMPSMDEAQLRALGYATGELHGFFKKIGGAFKAIAAPARKAFAAVKKFTKPIAKLVKPITRKINPRNVMKGVRGGIGMALSPLAMVPGMPPDLAGKIGGFSGGLAKTMADVGKGFNIGGSALLTVAGFPGVSSMLGSAGAGGLTSFLSSAGGKGFMGGSFGGQAGGLMMKDGLGSIFKIAQGAGGSGGPGGGLLDKIMGGGAGGIMSGMMGQWSGGNAPPGAMSGLMSMMGGGGGGGGGAGGLMGKVSGMLGGLMGAKYNESQMPPETVEAMEPNVVYPAIGDAQMGMAPFVAGSSSMAPGGGDYAPRRLGSQGGYNQAQVNFQPTAIQEAQVFPQQPSTAPTPMQDFYMNQAPYIDQKSIREMVAKSQAAEAGESTEVTPVDDVEIDDSLQGILHRARRVRRVRQLGGFFKKVRQKRFTGRKKVKSMTNAAERRRRQSLRQRI